MRQLADFRVCGTLVDLRRSREREVSGRNRHRSACKEANSLASSASSSDKPRSAMVIKDMRTIQNKGGRCKTRIRYPYRSCRQRHLESEQRISLITVNMQGWNWAKQEDRHRLKSGALVMAARAGQWDVVALSDLHCAMSEDGSFDCRDCIVALEEYIIVVGDKTGFLLSPAAAQAWRESGCTKWRCEVTGRMLMIAMKIHGVEYDFVSSYCPHTGLRPERRGVF
eukprot:gnl/MRDRNA2_/MRDRNA2_62018_c0_seq1.p1 gnl/MRDRNA2_/MRDRNA2_62018_c0~~gnl/MRDRNA2_/MRDRNA2_62018_c0_seq1.p1  ORF type:complete len:225 (+),score=23.29 gnl/MRDRNA2_/MRDRNA2_62018_c0_seq1:552-1226(+)